MHRQRWRPVFLAGLASLMGFAIAAPTTASAAVIGYNTPANATLDGQPIAASATFMTLNGGLTLLLENLESDPVSIVQNISGIQFTVTDATSATLESSAGKQRTVAQDGSFSDSAARTTDWLFAFGGGAFSLTALGANGPDETIVGAPSGANSYTSGNGSIADNQPHNPFLALNALFGISALGVTEDSMVSDVVLFFGTEPIAVNAICGEGCEPVLTGVPEPATLLLLGTGLIGLARINLRRGAKQKRTRVP